MKVPGKTGWAPFPGDYRLLENSFPGTVLATDCSAFDWTFPSWLVDVILETRMEQMRYCSQEYAAAAKARWNEVLGTDCVVRLPDGTRLRQRVKGIMKSGWLKTISVNSHAQDNITRLAWKRSRKDDFPLLWAMGDDVLMRWPGGDPDSLVAEIKKLGIITKMATTDRDFAGFRFSLNHEVIPLYPDKHKFILAHAAEDQVAELSSAYGLLYSLTPEEKRGWVSDIVKKYGRWTWRVNRLWAMGLINPGLTTKANQSAAQFFKFWD